MKKIELTELQLDDSIFISRFVLDDEIQNIFKLSDQPTRILPYPNNFHNAVTYELSNKKNFYFRTVYGFLDWLRDIGGLYGAIYGICFAIVFTIQFQGQNMFLMTEMFTVPQDENLSLSSRRKRRLSRGPSNLREIHSTNNV